MCGIAGYILHEPRTGAHPAAAALAAGIAGRGPDGAGVCYIGPEGHARVSGAALPHQAALFHSRFAIIDPSPAAAQPFVTRDGSCVLAFNGEIYNYRELRLDLEREGAVFRTASDTEVLAEGWRCWREGVWERLNGFWAAVLHDQRDGTMVLCRDRLGVAPLYLRQTAEGVFFCSLLAPLKMLAPVQEDEDALEGFVRTGFKDIGGRTVFRGILSLPPASAFVFSPGRALLGATSRHAFWSFPSTPLTPSDISLDEAVRHTRDLLFDAVRLRLRADVPLAAELSGGLDSSSVVAAALQLYGGRLRTYTLKVRGRDEEPFAAAMRSMHDLDYRVLSPDESGLSLRAAAFAGVMEEPYDTPANLVHHEMLQSVRREGVRVILTGAGGDESFAGYEASFWPAAYREWRAYDRAAADWYEFCRRYRSPEEARVTLGSYARALGRRGRRGTAAVSGRTAAEEAARASERMDFFARRRFHVDTAMLPYYLRSTDHYTMNIPLEHRFPLLDYRIVEFGLRLPAEYLFRAGWTKFVLRKAMEPFLPAAIVWRRQKFGFPFDYARYFTAARAGWLPVLARFRAGSLTPASFPDYDGLVRRDPLLLWRMLSVVLWRENT